VAALAVEGERCGVDVEIHSGRQLPSRAVSAREATWLRGRPVEDGLRLWVRKEAAVKAGAGDLARAAEMDVLDAWGAPLVGPGTTGSSLASLEFGEWSGAHAVVGWAVPVGTAVTVRPDAGVEDCRPRREGVPGDASTDVSVITEGPGFTTSSDDG
jgi:hypothetical protein